jgi:phosphate transport system substrate-binding protein
MNHLTRIVIAVTLTVLSWTTQAGEGALALTTEPNDADIYIDGTLKANSSPIVLKLPEGKHQVEVSKTGKQSQHFEIVISDGAVVVKKILLIDPPAASKQPPLVKEEKKEDKIDLSQVLTPKREMFETVQEFEKRWQQLIEDFNQAVQRHDPRYQAGVAILRQEDYDLASGTFPVRLKPNSWAQPFNFPSLSNIAVLREEAKTLWQEGPQKPLFVYLALNKNQVIIKQIVLTGINKEWVIQNILGLLSSRVPKSLTTLIDAWYKEYKTLYPQVQVRSQPYPKSEIATIALTGLLEGTSNLVFLPRPMTTKEVQTFTEKFGYAPTGLRVGLEAVAVYVHNDNPIKGLTLLQLDAIFSVARKCGGDKEMKFWGDLGVTETWLKDGGQWLGLGGGEAVAWDKLTIQPFGRPPESSIAELFQEKALCKGELKKNIKPTANSKAAIAIADRAVNNISFASLTEEEVPNVKALPIENKGTGYLSDFVKPTLKNAMAGQYPLARLLWLYVNKRPHKLLPPVQNEFIKFILSGQALLTAAELVPLPSEVIKEELATLEKVEKSGL